MGKDPEELKQEIEATREELGRDVDALTEKVSPSRVVQRRVDRARSSIMTAKENLMGVASSGTESASQTSSAAVEESSSLLAPPRQR